MTENASTSGAAVCKESQSGKRYYMQDRIEEFFRHNQGMTAKEAARKMGLQFEEYCDCPKRIHDLVNAKPPRLRAGAVRACLITGNQATTFWLPGFGVPSAGQVAAMVNEATPDDMTRQIPIQKSRPADAAATAKFLADLRAVL